jgi:hypothetical protein
MALHLVFYADINIIILESGTMLFVHVISQDIYVMTNEQ